MTGFILVLDLPHPPSGYVSLPKSITVAHPLPVNYAFRSTDGSNYNPFALTIGIAGSLYAGSVASTNNSPKTALPNPGLVFDTLLKRDKFEQHPDGISSAGITTSSLNAFWTSMRTRHTRRLSRRQEGERQRNAQDDEIFNRTRLVNCGYFMNIILGDYVGAILGLVRDQSDWRLDPLQPIREANHNFTPVGEGNVISVEFNLLYRWHSTLSAQDTEWFENDVFKRTFPGVNPAELTTQQSSSRKSRMAWSSRRGAIPGNGYPAGLKRDASGRFKDGGLANALQNATDWYAGAFKARNSLKPSAWWNSWPSSSRGHGVHVLKFLGLKLYTTFKDWNPDPKVHTAAAALYKDIDNLELHVGLQVEEAKKPGPGAGLCPGYTISRAILADAVCLTHGDRFMTVDLTRAYPLSPNYTRISELCALITFPILHSTQPHRLGLPRLPIRHARWVLRGHADEAPLQDAAGLLPQGLRIRALSLPVAAVYAEGDEQDGPRARGQVHVGPPCAEARGGASVYVRGREGTSKLPFLKFHTPTHARFLRWDRAGVVVSQTSNYKKDPGFLCEFLWHFSHMSHEQRGGDMSVVVATKDEERIFKQVSEAHIRTQLGAQPQDVLQAEYARHYENFVTKISVLKSMLVQVCKDSKTREKLATRAEGRQPKDGLKSIKADIEEVVTFDEMLRKNILYCVP
ncbi:heme peroxidase [Pholiota conissans]|uniref:Heme peroxidase n=1 Tax=Pholiota conissans TaxID=109636 RepID=A0A9P5YLR2_9AGAR|nr:heme peroxidase [Pholiota conissans]